jgi:hypothetical protein
MTEPGDLEDPITLDTPLQAVRQWLWENVWRKPAAKCPACGRRATVDYYQIERVWVEKLALMARAPNQWFHLVELGERTKGGKETFLRHWGLIEREEGHHRADGNPRRGFYRITQKGIQFLRGEIPVPRKAAIFAAEMRGYKDPNDLVYVNEVEGFDYGKWIEENG